MKQLILLLLILGITLGQVPNLREFYNYNYFKYFYNPHNKDGQITLSSSKKYNISFNINAEKEPTKIDEITFSSSDDKYMQSFEFFDSENAFYSYLYKYDNDSFEYLKLDRCHKFNYDHKGNITTDSGFILLDDKERIQCINVRSYIYDNENLKKIHTTYRNEIDTINEIEDSIVFEHSTYVNGWGNICYGLVSIYSYKEDKTVTTSVSYDLHGGIYKIESSDGSSAKMEDYSTSINSCNLDKEQNSLLTITNNHLILPMSSDYMVELYSTDGKLLRKFSGRSQRVNLKSNELSDGIYQIRALIGGELFSGKVMIK